MRDSPRGRSGERIGREPDMAEGITHGVDLQDPGQGEKPADSARPALWSM
jgi:hypothetical protein